MKSQLEKLTKQSKDLMVCVELLRNTNRTQYTHDSDDIISESINNLLMANFQIHKQISEIVGGIDD